MVKIVAFDSLFCWNTQHDTCIGDGCEWFYWRAFSEVPYEHGFDITCLVRPSSDRSRLERFRPRYVTGDILDAESIQEAVTEADIVFHLAGSTKSLRLAEMERTNVMVCEMLRRPV